VASAGSVRFSPVVLLGVCQYFFCLLLLPLSFCNMEWLPDSYTERTFPALDFYSFCSLFMDGIISSVYTGSYDWAAINQLTRMWKGGYVAQFMVCPSSSLKGLRKTTHIFKFVCFPGTIRIINTTNTSQKLYRFLNCVHHFLCGPEIVSSSVYSLHVTQCTYQLIVQIFTYNCHFVILIQHDSRRYKPEGRVFNSRWCHWNFSLT
jgi:hypothetical protein